jgi:hypothetical protein
MLSSVSPGSETGPEGAGGLREAKLSKISATEPRRSARLSKLCGSSKSMLRVNGGVLVDKVKKMRTPSCHQLGHHPALLVKSSSLGDEHEAETAGCSQAATRSSSATNIDSERESTELGATDGEMVDADSEPGTGTAVVQHVGRVFSHWVFWEAYLSIKDPLTRLDPVHP